MKSSGELALASRVLLLVHMSILTGSDLPDNSVLVI